MAIAECRRLGQAADEPLTEESLSDRINGIFDASEQAVFGVDAQGHIAYWNRHCEQLFELPQNMSLRGKHVADLLCGADPRCAGDDCSGCAIHRNMCRQTQINDVSLTRVSDCE